MKREVIMSNHKYKKNIFLSYVFNFTKNLDVTQGIWMLFLASKGVSLLGLGILEGIFHVVSFCMETPTGAIADLYGRKLSRSLGVVFQIIAILLIVFGDSYFMYLLSFIILPISYNLESGAGEALLYDSLKELGEEGKYMKYKGRVEVTYQLAAVCALIIGGFIGSFSHEWVYWVALVIAIAALIQALFFEEVPVQKKGHQSHSAKEAIIKQYRDSLSLIKNSRRLVYLIIFAALMSTFITVSFYYLQNYWKANGATEWTIGIVLACASLGGALGGALTEKIEAYFGEKRLLKILPLALTATLWGLPFIEASYIAFGILTFVDAVMCVAVSHYMNKLIESDKRATIISFESMMFSFSMIFVFPLFGGIGDYFGMRSAFVLLAVFATVMSFVNYYLLCNARDKETKAEANDKARHV